MREAFIAGAVGVGIPRCEDYNSGDHQEGVGYFRRAIYRGYRHSAARVFLHPAGATGQLEVRTDSRAAQILFDGTRAVGVRYVDDRDRTVQRGGRLGHAEHAVREYLFSTMMIAEKASDMIRGRPPLAPVEGIAA